MIQIFKIMFLISTLNPSLITSLKIERNELSLSINEPTENL
jgi:hypothetical protein